MLATPPTQERTSYSGESVPRPASLFILTQVCSGKIRRDQRASVEAKLARMDAFTKKSIHDQGVDSFKWLVFLTPSISKSVIFDVEAMGAQAVLHDNPASWFAAERAAVALDRIITAHLAPGDGLGRTFVSRLLDLAETAKPGKPFYFTHGYEYHPTERRIRHADPFPPPGASMLESWPPFRTALQLPQIDRASQVWQAHQTVEPIWLRGLWGGKIEEGRPWEQVDEVLRFFPFVAARSY